MLLRRLAVPSSAVRRLLVGSAVALVCAATLGALAVIGKAWWDSRLPGTYSVMDYGTIDHGGGAEGGWHAYGAHGGGVSVADLHGPAGVPDARFTLTAREATIRLASGRSVDALTFDGRSPGPELRVRQGDLVEVTLENEDVEQGVTIHWHGVDVPNAEDGVAGVTQDAVLPGERHVYRFPAEQVGTFWYHTHQVSSKEVRRGLFGALVIEPKEGSSYAVDQVLVAHTYDGFPTLNGSDGIAGRRIPPGSEVRLRIVNTDSTPHRFALQGTRFVVSALDGSDLNAPSLLVRTEIEIAGGGRADLAFTMPRVPVRLSWIDTEVGLALNGGSSRPFEAPTREFDPLTYGSPAPTPFDAGSDYDRRFDLTITRKPGFLAGRPGLQWAINGGIYPDVPVFVVEEGDLVEVTITNDTDGIHPMHLHGHHVLVLSRDGEPATGSPWWSDTLNVLPGERYVVAFRADNPGIWMDHCHNLRHAADGLTMHVAYTGVTTPFMVGDAHHNTPE
jgi:FtsP/CotA-like multicopper oxidase with cupredoxin domain